MNFEYVFKSMVSGDRIRCPLTPDGWCQELEKSKYL